MSTVFDRVALWNGMRYEQVNSPDLTARLLYEECHEYDASTNNVDRLDALCDIIYVAIGGMWKMGLSPVQIEVALDIICDSNDSKKVVLTDWNQKANDGDKGENYHPPEPLLASLLQAIGIPHE